MRVRASVSVSAKKKPHYPLYPKKKSSTYVEDFAFDRALVGIIA